MGRSDETTFQQNESLFESRFRRLVANIPGVIYQYVLCPNGTEAFTYISDRSQEIYEYEPDVLMQDFGLVWQMVHPDDAAQVRTANLASAEQLHSFDIEFRILPPSGTLKWLHVMSTPARQPNGDILWDGIVMDITERKQTQLNDQFLAELDLRLRHCSDAETMAWEVVSRLGDYLKVDRCLWHEIDWDTRSTTVDHPWRRETVPDVSGTYALDEYFTPQQLTRFAAGRTLVVHDVTTHPDTAPYAENYLPLGAGAFVSVPCLYSGRWVAVLAVNAKTARHWRDDEVTLLQATVTRLWSIIEQTRAVQALQESEARFRTLADNIAQLAWIADEKGWIFWYNQRWFDYTGTTLEQMQGWGWRQVHHPDHVDRVVDRVRHCFESGETWEDTFPLRGKDGHYRWFLSRAIPLRDEFGKVCRWIGTNTDITEREQAQTELQERNAHIQLLYETTRDLLSTTQPLALVETLFAKLKPLFGLDVYLNYLLDENQQTLHLTFHGGISDETAQAIEWLDVGCAICGTVAQRRSQIVQNHLQQCTDPKAELARSLGLTAYSCQPLLAQGKLFGTLSFSSRSRTEFTPIETGLFQALCDQIAIALERADLMTSLQQQTEELMKANRLKDEFLAALSHELRTPLNPILGWTKMLRAQRLTPTRTAEALATIERNVKQQIALVDDLLDVSRVIQGSLHLDFHQVDLIPALMGAIETVQVAAQAKGITIQVSQDRLSSVHLMGDRTRLQQVFWNLLSNAIKFTPEGGEVNVDLSIVPSNSATHAVQISITDTGIGISPEFLPYVFDHFRQADGSTTRRYGGLGLGLSIVEHLVELHGGTVTVASPGAGQGSTFTVKLPLPVKSGVSNRATAFLKPESVSSSEEQSVQNATPKPPHPAPAMSSESAPPLLKDVRILLVDDDPDNLDLLRFLLQMDGAAVTAMTSPLDALKLVSTQSLDLIISDIGMPEINGYEFIRRIRALPQGQQIPALALTAFARQEDQEEAIAAGFQAYIAKPVDPLQLLAALPKLLKH
jgi:PAS domain S-box-containing protein